MAVSQQHSISKTLWPNGIVFYLFRFVSSQNAVVTAITTETAQKVSQLKTSSIFPYRCALYWAKSCWNVIRWLIAGTDQLFRLLVFPEALWAWIKNGTERTFLGLCVCVCEIHYIKMYEKISITKGRLILPDATAEGAREREHQLDIPGALVWWHVSI